MKELKPLTKNACIPNWDAVNANLDEILDLMAEHFGYSSRESAFLSLARYAPEGWHPLECIDAIAKRAFLPGHEMRKLLTTIDPSKRDGANANVNVCADDHAAPSPHPFRVRRIRES